MDGCMELHKRQINISVYHAELPCHQLKKKSNQNSDPFQVMIKLNITGFGILFGEESFSKR